MEKKYLTPTVDITYSLDEVILTSEQVVDVDDLFLEGGIE